MLRATTILLFAALMPCAAFADEPCHLLQVASLAMQTQPDGEVSVPASVNSRPVQLLVDTGSIFSSLTITTAQELGLKRLGLQYANFEFVNNRRITEYTRLDSFGLGSATGKNLTFFVLPGGLLPASLEGMLGPDVMRNFDIEFDFVGGKFNVLSPNSCAASPVYWTHEPYAEVPIEIADDGHMFLRAQLDGQSVRVGVDTGASRSTMALETARDLFRLQDQDARLKRMPSQRINNGAEVPIYKYSFAALSFEGIQVANPDIDLIPESSFGEERGTTLILGMSVLRQLHLYIGYKAQKLYLTAAEAR